MQQHDDADLILSQLIEVWDQLSTHFVQHSDQLIKNQLAYWQDYMQLLLTSELNAKFNGREDKRFQHKAWHENASLNFIKQNYLLFSQHISDLIKNITEKADTKLSNKLQFYIKQHIDAFSPSNFFHLNPEVLAQTLEKNGVNLITGMKHFLKDLKNGQGLLNIKTSDFTSFQLGKNIACTPGKVVYQNELMQLIQYETSTKTVYQYPLLIIPPWINKYYILDLQQKNSLVKWLVDRGMTVFMISWVNPNDQHRKMKFANYLVDGPLTALKKIKQMTKVKKMNVLGYCIGGTLLGCMLAYLAKKNKTDIRSATFLTTLFDFSEPGDLGVFIDDEQLSRLDKHMEARGYLDGKMMVAVFNALRANDLVWSAFVNNYLKGQQPKSFDLLYWNADSTNIPSQVHRFYLRDMYLNNNLIKPGKIKLAGVLLDLSKIKVPSYFLAAEDDHIAPWQSVYKSSQYYGGKVKFVLTTSGHVAGVINPPYKKKYSYYTHSKKTKSAETFLSSSDLALGSWWNNWLVWLKKYSGKRQSVANLTIQKYQVIEDAPGSYVKVRLPTSE